MNNGHLTFVEILLAMFAEAVIFVQAVIANVDIVAVLVDSKGNFVSAEIFVALIAE